MSRVLWIGYPEYVGGVLTEQWGRSINTSTIQFTYQVERKPPAPGSATWYNAQVYYSTNPAGAAYPAYQRAGALLIGAAPHVLTAGTYHLFGRIPDTPEDLVKYVTSFEVKATS